MEKYWRKVNYSPRGVSLKTQVLNFIFRRQWSSCWPSNPAPKGNCRSVHGLLDRRALDWGLVAEAVNFSLRLEASLSFSLVILHIPGMAPELSGNSSGWVQGVGRGGRRKPCLRGVHHQSGHGMKLSVCSLGHQGTE